MATTSNMPRGPRAPSISSQEPGAQKIEALRTGRQTSPEQAPHEAGRQAATDKFSKTNVNLVVKQMKETVAKQSLQVFHPEKLVQGGTGEDLSEFEKVFMEYFMGQRTLGTLLKKGEKKFREKQIKEWKEFYEILYSCAVEKTVPMNKVVALIFRGICQDDPRPPLKTEARHGWVLIADLYIERPRRSRCEKFVRIPIPNQDILAQLQKSAWGEEIAPQQAVQYFGTGDLEYLALYYRPVRPGLMGARHHPEFQRLHEQAQAAARAREAMFNRRMGVSAKSSNLAERQMQGKERSREPSPAEPPTPSPAPAQTTTPAPTAPNKTNIPNSDTDLYNQKNLLDKLLLS